LGSTPEGYPDPVFGVSAAVRLSTCVGRSEDEGNNSDLQEQIDESDAKI